MYTIPQYPRLLSLLSLITGIAAFIWLTPESDTALWPALLGLLISGLGVAHQVFRHAGRGIRLGVWLPLLGGVSGAGGALAAAALMFIKTAAHAHPLPEFPPEMMIGMVARLPAWGVAGVLIGLALFLLLPRKNG